MRNFEERDQHIQLGFCGPRGRFRQLPWGGDWSLPWNAFIKDAKQSTLFRDSSRDIDGFETDTRELSPGTAAPSLRLAV